VSDSAKAYRKFIRNGFALCKEWGCFEGVSLLLTCLFAFVPFGSKQAEHPSEEYKTFIKWHNGFRLWVIEYTQTDLSVRKDAVSIDHSKGGNAERHDQKNCIQATNQRSFRLFIE